MDGKVDEVLARQGKQEDGDRGLEDYFSSEELASISDYEKKRLKNMKLNYEMMLEVGKHWTNRQWGYMKNFAADHLLAYRAGSVTIPVRFLVHKFYSLPVTAYSRVYSTAACTI